MGCTSSAISSLKFDRSNPVYLTDDIVSGQVKLEITDECKADAVYLSLRGELCYMTHSGSGKRRRTHRHHVPFYSFDLIFLRPETGQDELTLNVGSYSWPFQAKLPSTLPPSLNVPTKYPSIRYYAQFVIDKAWYKPNYREYCFFIVYPRVEIQRNPIIPLEPPGFVRYNRKDVHLEGTLDKLVYYPGENINVKFQIDNPKQVTIQRITISMYQFYKIGPSRSGTSLFPMVFSEFINTRQAHFNETRSFPIPNLLIPPTFEFIDTNIARCHIQLYYYLKFDVEVEGFFTDFDVRLPFIMGPHPNINEGASNIPPFPFSGHIEQMIADEEAGSVTVQVPQGGS